MQELNEIIGNNAATVFIATFGGQVIHFPRYMHPAHRIASAIGFEAAMKLSTRWAGVSVPIPGNCAKNRHERNLRIRSDRRAGMPLNDLSQKYQLTTRQISKITQPLKL